MTTRDPDDKERTSLHEAGHAVVAWSYGGGHWVHPTRYKDERGQGEHHNFPF